MAIISGLLFLTFTWPVALLGVAGLNAILSIRFWFKKRRREAKLAGLAAILFLATLFFTDWGLPSVKHVARVAWPCLIAACVAELALIVFWCSKKRAARKRKRNPERQNPSQATGLT